MADILRSQPVAPGFENAPVRNQPLTPQDGSIQNAPNPSRVTNPDGKTEREDGSSQLLSNSNYESFIRELAADQGLLENLAGVLFTDLEALAAGGKAGELFEKLAGFLELITVEEGDLLSFVKDQAAHATEFGGPFFRMLKDAFDETAMLQLKTAILRAGSKYGDMASANHTIKTILTECSRLGPHLFLEDKGELEKIMEKLVVLKGPYPKDAAQFLSILKKGFDDNRQVLLKELIPFFAAYTKRTHDMGVPRERMLLITDQVARYLNGSPDEMQELFSRLLTYGEVAGRFKSLSTDNLLMILGGLLRKRLEEEDDRMTAGFCSLLEAGLKGGSKESFNGMVTAMLRGDSVYLPLLHLMVPIRVGGRTMLSELWVDPDAGGEGNGSGSGNGRGGNLDAGRNIRLLLRMEIKGLGSFDFVIGCRDRQVDMRVFYPVALKEKDREIRTAIGSIAAQNGFRPENLQTEVRRDALLLTDVFPKIMKRKDSVNVRV